jgi:hypothetical protein
MIMRTNFIVLIFLTTSFFVTGQTMVVDNVRDSSLTMDNKSKYCNILKGGFKYLFNSSKNTRDLLASAGYQLDQTANEFFIKYKDLPKVFYVQQLGTIKGGKYASLNGFGIKQDLRKSVFSTNNMFLTPYAEFGVGYYRLSLIEGIGENSSITATVDPSFQQRTLDNITVTGDVGLDLGFGFNFDNRRLMFILNGGFMTNFPTQWRSGGSIAYNEKLNILSPYAGLSVAIDMNCNNGCCK